MCAADPPPARTGHQADQPRTEFYRLNARLWKPGLTLTVT